MQKYLDIFSRCPLFEGIQPAEMPAMLGCIGAQLREYGRNEIIFSEGDPARQMGIVLRGSAQVIKEDYYGRRSIVASVQPGELFGESFACAQVEQLPVSVIAAERSEILLVDCHRITITCSSACSFHNRMILNLLHVVAEKNLIFNRKVEILSRRSTREKLMTYLMNQAKQQESARFTIPFDRQELADYLGVERSALSAEISKLRNEGILEANRSQFTLL